MTEITNNDFFKRIISHINNFDPEENEIFELASAIDTLREFLEEQDDNVNLGDYVNISSLKTKAFPTNWRNEIHLMDNKYNCLVGSDFNEMMVGWFLWKRDLEKGVIYKYSGEKYLVRLVDDIDIERSRDEERTTRFVLTKKDNFDFLIGAVIVGVKKLNVYMGTAEEEDRDIVRENIFSGSSKEIFFQEDELLINNITKENYLMYDKLEFFIRKSIEQGLFPNSLF